MYILSWIAMIIQICFVTLAIGKFPVNDSLTMESEFAITDPNRPTYL